MRSTTTVCQAVALASADGTAAADAYGVHPGVGILVLVQQLLELGLVELVELGEPREPAPPKVRVGRVGGQRVELPRGRGGLREPTQGGDPSARCLRQGEAQVGDPGHQAVANRRVRPLVGRLDEPAEQGLDDRVGGLAGQHADPAVDEPLGRQLAVVQQAPRRRQGDGASHGGRQLAAAREQQVEGGRVGTDDGEGQVLVVDQQQVGVGAAVELGALAVHPYVERVEQDEPGRRRRRRLRSADGAGAAAGLLAVSRRE